MSRKTLVDVLHSHITQHEQEDFVDNLLTALRSEPVAEPNQLATQAKKPPSDSDKEYSKPHFPFAIQCWNNMTHRGEGETAALSNINSVHSVEDRTFIREHIKKDHKRPAVKVVFRKRNRRAVFVLAAMRLLFPR